MPKGKKAAASAPETQEEQSRGRGRPAKAKSNIVATPALKAEALAEYSDLRSKVAAAAARVAASLKRFEGQGVQPEWTKFAYSEARFTSEEAAQRHVDRTEVLVATGVISVADSEWLGSVSQGAFDLTPAAGEAGDRVKEAKAKRLGEAAGKKGHSLESNPWQNSIGSIEYVAWRDGHTDGMALRAILKPGSETSTVASTAPGPRLVPTTPTKEVVH